MWKWLRSWFTWRFSLARLMVATVFMGSVVGLNLREIGPQIESCLAGSPNMMTVVRHWGWPLPFLRRLEEWNLPKELKTFATDNDSLESRSHAEMMDMACDFSERWQRRASTARAYLIPFTHQTYYLLDCAPLIVTSRLEYRYLIWGGFDALFALTGVALILFLQIPRRKAPSTPPPVRDGGLRKPGRQTARATAFLIDPARDGAAGFGSGAA